MTKEQEEYLWELAHIKHPTVSERNGANYDFLKKTYWDLVVHFLKVGDEKTVNQLQQSFKEVETLFKS